MELRETISDWLVSPETAYLIGAGCSLCAGKPLIGQLTDRIVPKLGPRIQELYTQLRGVGRRSATIEDLMNHLLKRHDILTSLNRHDHEPLTSEEISQAIETIRYNIVDEIRDDWDPVDHHMRFFRRIGSGDRQPRDIFTLNYDTVIEASLEALRDPYTDGFIGAENAYFDPNTFTQGPDVERFFRLYKMHGSINWVRDEEDFIRRKPVRSIQRGSEPIVVYPSEQKYLQTQFGAYETLMGLFRNRLRCGSSNNKLVCLGYSFNDEHIKEAIIDAARQDGNNLSVYAFVGPEQYEDGDITEQKLRLSRIEARCPGRINFYVGEQSYIGSALDREHSEALLELTLWKFEELVNFIAGAIE